MFKLITLDINHFECQAAHNPCVLSTVTCLASGHSPPGHPQFQDSQGETLNRFVILLVYMSKVNINTIKQHFLFDNQTSQIITRNSEHRLKRDYHRMLWKSQGCLETESQSISSSLSHGGLVWS